MEDGPAKIAHYSLDATPHIQREIQIIHPHERKSRDPFTKLRSYFERAFP